MIARPAAPAEKHPLVNGPMMRAGAPAYSERAEVARSRESAIIYGKF